MTELAQETNESRFKLNISSSSGTSALSIFSPINREMTYCIICSDITKHTLVYHLEYPVCPIKDYSEKKQQSLNFCPNCGHKLT